MKKLLAWCLLIGMLFALTGCNEKEEPEEDAFDWRAATTAKYREDENVRQLIVIQGDETSDARLMLYEKSFENGKPVWTETLNCEALIGLNGLGKTKEGDIKTPVGDFSVLTAFGVKANPGTSLPYIDVNENTYGCCCNEKYYNCIVDITEDPSVTHDLDEDEHMMALTPEYNYGFFISYNEERTVGKGNCIFIHCTGVKPYTGGCVAVSEENMIQILKAIDENVRVIINYKG